MFKRKTCSIHGDYDGKVCGFCAMGNRLKSLDRNALIQRIEELEAVLPVDYWELHLNLGELQRKHDALMDRLRELAESWLPDIRTDSEGNLKRMNRVMTGTLCANELRALLEDDDD